MSQLNIIGCLEYLVNATISGLFTLKAIKFCGRKIAIIIRLLQGICKG